MPLQNRVTPFGDIVALAGRGLVIGNRGVLHDETRHIVRHSQVRRWIACRLEFRGRRRKIMRPRSWTELFFLDEATALAATPTTGAFVNSGSPASASQSVRISWTASFTPNGLLGEAK
jgi:hypothetical protein